MPQGRCLVSHFFLLADAIPPAPPDIGCSSPSTSDAVGSPGEAPANKDWVQQSVPYVAPASDINPGGLPAVPNQLPDAEETKDPPPPLDPDKQRSSRERNNNNNSGSATRPRRTAAQINFDADNYEEEVDDSEDENPTQPKKGRSGAQAGLKSDLSNAPPGTRKEEGSSRNVGGGGGAPSPQLQAPPPKKIATTEHGGNSSAHIGGNKTDAIGCAAAAKKTPGKRDPNAADERRAESKKKQSRPRSGKSNKSKMGGSISTKKKRLARSKSSEDIEQEDDEGEVNGDADKRPKRDPPKYVVPALAADEMSLTQFWAWVDANGIDRNRIVLEIENKRRGSNGVLKSVWVSRFEADYRCRGYLKVCEGSVKHRPNECAVRCIIILDGVRQQKLLKVWYCTEKVSKKEKTDAPCRATKALYVKLETEPAVPEQEYLALESTTDFRMRIVDWLKLDGNDRLISITEAAAPACCPCCLRPNPPAIVPPAIVPPAAAAATQVVPAIAAPAPAVDAPPSRDVGSALSNQPPRKGNADRATLWARGVGVNRFIRAPTPSPVPASTSPLPQQAAGIATQIQPDARPAIPTDGPGAPPPLMDVPPLPQERSAPVAPGGTVAIADPPTVAGLPTSPTRASEFTFDPAAMAAASLLFGPTHFVEQKKDMFAECFEL
jgi:hypothetical protein